LRVPSSLTVGVLCLITTLPQLPLRAQLSESEHPRNVAMSFNPGESKVLDTLTSLEMLPSGAWRFHSGDVAHGESLTLDDSSWELVTPRSEAGKDAVWYRQTIRVPKTLHGYDLTGAQIDFRFRAFGNGPMPEILYFNGRRVALGDDLEQVQLFSDAKPGDAVVVAVKVLRTVDVKTFDHVEL
jgi:alpha-mannosidase